MFPMSKKATTVEYVCTWCGMKVMRAATAGRPMPGCCTRKPKSRNGMTKPHTWVINRRL